MSRPQIAFLISLATSLALFALAYLGGPYLAILVITTAVLTAIVLLIWSTSVLRKLAPTIAAKKYYLPAVREHFLGNVLYCWILVCFGLIDVFVSGHRLDEGLMLGLSKYRMNWISMEQSPAWFLTALVFWMLSAALLFFGSLAGAVYINDLAKDPGNKIDRNFG